MKCLRCTNPAKAGHTLCAECLLWRPDSEGSENASKVQTLVCIKCGKPAEPTKVLCAECLGKHQPISKHQALRRRDRKKKSRLRLVIELLLRRFLTNQDAATVTYRSEIAADIIIRITIATLLLLLAFLAWQNASNFNTSPKEAKNSPDANSADSRTSRRRATFTNQSSPNAATDLIFSSPQNGAVFQIGDTITLTAEPTSSSHKPYQVRFSTKGSVLCKVQDSPFTCSWSPQKPGNYLLEAQSFNATGVGGPITTLLIKALTPETYKRMNLTGEPLRIFITTPSDETHLVLDPLTSPTPLHFKGWFFAPTRNVQLIAQLNQRRCTLSGLSDFSGECAVDAPGNYTLTIEASDSKKGTLIAKSSLLVAVSRTSSIDATTEMNPYYSQDEIYESVQDWGASGLIWDENEHFASVIIPEREASRLGPVFYDASVAPSVGRFAGMQRLSATASAGSFDDYVATLSAEMTPFSLLWNDPSSNTSIPLQPRLFGFTGTPPIPGPLNRPAKYSVPTYANRGIALLSFSDETGSDSLFSTTSNKNVLLERDHYFLNTLPLTAAGESYTDVLPEHASDHYDGLFTHYFVGAGEKGVENQAIVKLLAAGSFLPYETKRTLKMTGNYAAFLQWLWRAALPYSDETGAPLPFSHQARHRPSYLTKGDLTLPSLAANTAYHGYNEPLHMREMARIATLCKGTLPPVTLLSLVDYSVARGSEPIVQNAPWDEKLEHIKLMLPTVARIWGAPNETISVRIDLGRSYDIFGKQLTYNVAPLYPEHASLVAISQETPSQFLITATYDAKFPRTRIPLIATASNGTFEGAPAFINFFWPDENDAAVGQNKRPLVSSPTPPQISARVGATVKIPLTCSDPEGFKTSWVRWLHEPGKIENSTYHFTVPPEYVGRTLTLHFICSDGTGGYAGLERTLHVE